MFIIYDEDEIKIMNLILYGYESVITFYFFGYESVITLYFFLLYTRDNTRYLLLPIVIYYLHSLYTTTTDIGKVNKNNSDALGEP